MVTLVWQKPASGGCGGERCECVCVEAESQTPPPGSQLVLQHSNVPAYGTYGPVPSCTKTPRAMKLLMALIVAECTDIKFGNLASARLLQAEKQVQLVLSLHLLPVLYSVPGVLYTVLLLCASLPQYNTVKNKKKTRLGSCNVKTR